MEFQNIINSEYKRGERDMKQPAVEIRFEQRPPVNCYPEGATCLIESAQRNPDAHIGVEEKPYVPLVHFNYHGSNHHRDGHGKK